VLAVGLNGKNVAKDTAEDSKVKWKGIGCVMEKIRDAGTQNFTVMSGRIEDFEERTD